MSDDTDHLKAKLARAEEALKAMTAERDKAVTARHIAAAATAAGVLPSSVDDVVNRAINSGDWVMDRRTGQIVRHIDGFPDTDMNCDKVTAGRFMNRLREDAPQYFGGSSVQSGGGATGAGQSVSSKNPWSKEGWDDMAQAAAYKADPVEAEKLAKAAGSRIGALRPA